MGSFLAGLSTVIIAIAAVRTGPAAIRDWRARQRAQAAAAREEAETIRLDRRVGLSGWSAASVNTYPVVLVTSEGGMAQAGAELVSGEPSASVILRVAARPCPEMMEGLRLRVRAGGRGGQRGSGVLGQYRPVRN